MNIIVDNTNTKFWEMKPYVEIAQQNGYEIEFAEPNWHPELKNPQGKWNFNFIKGRNVHGVPDNVLNNMINRYEYDPSVENVLKSNKPEFR